MLLAWLTCSVGLMNCHQQSILTNVSAWVIYATGVYLDTTSPSPTQIVGPGTPSRAPRCNENTFQEMASPDVGVIREPVFNAVWGRESGCLPRLLYTHFNALFFKDEKKPTPPNLSAPFVFRLTNNFHNNVMGCLRAYPEYESCCLYAAQNNVFLFIFSTSYRCAVLIDFCLHPLNNRAEQWRWDAATPLSPSSV